MVHSGDGSLRRGSLLCTRGGAGAGSVRAAIAWRAGQYAVRLFAVLIMRDFPIQTGLAIALFGAVVGGARLLTPAPVKAPPAKAPVAAAPVVNKRAPDVLLDDSDGALDHFYQSLMRGGITRIVH